MRFFSHAYEVGFPELGVDAYYRVFDVFWQLSARFEVNGFQYLRLPVSQVPLLQPFKRLLNGPWRQLAGRGLYVALGQSCEVIEKGLVDATLQLIYCTRSEQLSKEFTVLRSAEFFGCMVSYDIQQFGPVEQRR